MSSPCRIELAGALLAAASLAGCGQGRPPSAYDPADQPAPRPTSVSELLPGQAPAAAEDPRGQAYDGDAASIAQGKTLYAAYNCGGCHFNGGGGIGPAFMDKVWIYGGRIDQIHNSIMQGRPNGMPTWGEKIPDNQIWRIAAYVRSLSTPSTQDEQPPTAAPPSVTPPAEPNHQGGQTSPP